MALEKSVPTRYGVAALYHRIAAAQVGWHDQGCLVTVFSYSSRAAREAGAAPLAVASFPFAGPAFDFAGGEPSRPQLYARLKALPEWADAADA